MTDGKAMGDGPEKKGHGRTPKPRCGAYARSTGNPCKRGAGAGTDHPGRGACSNHLGSTQTHEANAERVAAEQVVAAFGLQVDGTPPGEIILREIGRSSAMVCALAAQVSELTPEERAWAVANRKIRPAATPDGQPSVEVEQRAREHVLIGMLRTERHELRELIMAAHHAGVEERQIALAERHGAQIVAAFGGLLAELTVAWGLSVDQQEEYRAAVARQLHRLAAIESGVDRPG
jgi:hypothetical protein